MNARQTIPQWEAPIGRIKRQLQAQGALRPGSLSRPYNVCGKPGCRCKDPQRPRRHGPYYPLNYVYRGKKTSKFIRREILKQVGAELVNCKIFRRLVDQWIGLALRIAEAKEKRTPPSPTRA